MAAMSSADGGDLRRMPRGRQPVVNCCSNAPALDRRLALAMVTGDEEENTFAPSDRMLKAAIDCSPGSIEVHAVKIKDPVWLYAAVPQHLVPAAIKSPLADRDRFFPRFSRTFRNPFYDLWI